MFILQDAALLALFCSVDDFCQESLPLLRAKSLAVPVKRNRARSLCESEIITLLIAFQQSKFRDFKTFYLGFVHSHWYKQFPKLVSYNRFIEFVPSVLVLLAAYLRSLFGRCKGVSFIDSTALKVCHNRRIHQHQVFAPVAKRGKTSMDWFFGFKLHLAINHQGEIINAVLTTGNVHDVVPVPNLLQHCFGKVYADKAYLSESLRQSLAMQGIELITKLRKNMPKRPLPQIDAWLLKKRALVESVIDQIKNISQVEHSRHRASTGFVANLLAALAAYCHQEKKPSLAL